MAWKDGQTIHEVAEKVLRSYLIRCHGVIAADYPEIARMEPANAADYLLHLRRTNRIRIELHPTPDNQLRCKIIDAAEPDARCEHADGTDAASQGGGIEER